MGRLLLLASVFLAACQQPDGSPVQRLEPTQNNLRRVTVGIESRYALRGNDHTFALTIPPNATLELSVGVLEAAPASVRGGVEATAIFETGSGAVTFLHRTIGGAHGRLDPKVWHDFTVPLAALSGQQGTLKLRLGNTTGNAKATDAVVWGNPLLVPATPRAATNIILISLDTLRADRLGCYGNERDTSPNIDRMAREGVLFQRAISSSSWTLPSHASMLTGLDPYHHGAIRYGKSTPVRDELDTVAEQMWRAGWETAGFVGGGFVDGAFGFAQGFDRYRSQASQSFDSLEQNAGEAMRWIEPRVHRPFFLFLHSYQVHAPYAPPPPYDQLYDAAYDGPLRGRVATNDGVTLIQHPRILEHARALYDGLIRYADQTVGSLLDYLRASGLDRSTCVLLTSDHGEEFMEHGGVMHGHAKLYNELTHIPLIVWCPSQLAGGRTVPEVVSQVDITPTILELAGQPIPADIQGHSLVSLARGQAAAPGRAVVSETDGSVEGGAGTILSITTNRYRLIDPKFPKEQPRQLFDHVDDPAEQTNLYQSRPDLAQQLTGMLKETMAQRTGPPATAPQPVMLNPAQEEFLRALGYGDR